MSVFPIRVCCLVAFLLLAGCAHKLQFQVVDATTGAAVSGVEVKRRKVTSLSYFYRTLRERKVGSTDTAGMITVPGVTSKDVIHFDAPGYRAAAAGLAGDGAIRVNWALPPPMTPWTQPRQIVTNSDGTIVIPLDPVSRRE